MILVTIVAVCISAIMALYAIEANRTANRREHERDLHAKNQSEAERRCRDLEREKAEVYHLLSTQGLSIGGLTGDRVRLIDPTGKESEYPSLALAIQCYRAEIDLRAKEKAK
jgi:Na+/H+ antiporter NhaB